METLEQIKTLVEELSVDTTKFFKGNNSAGTRARKMAQDVKNLLQKLRTEILDERKKEGNE
jgi:tRNA A37 methylthiotransferase MiaB